MMVAQVIDHPFATGVIPTPYNPDPALLAIVEIIRDGLMRDQHVRLHNFGTFRLRWSRERQIKHPKTGASMTVGPRPKITFTPAKHLRNIIDPDRKAPVPLEETSSTNLTEAVQDVIDNTDYSPETNYSGPQLHTPTEKNNEQGQGKKWAMGLLAAVPLILALLQIDFSTDRNTIEEVNPALPPVKATSVTRQETSKTQIPADAINRSGYSQQHSEQSDNHSAKDNFLTTADTLRPESSPASFYMSPQVHTIQPGENLWKLAELFYGNARLWPHIFRANMRTLSDPDVIMTGSQLVIPGLQQSPGKLSEQDRALIAEGYYEIYQFNRAKQSVQAIYFLLEAKQFSMEWLTTMKAAIPRKDWHILSSKN